MITQSLVKEICPTTTQFYLAQGALLVDVRENDEVTALSYDVPNLLHIPLSEFETRYLEVPKNQQVVVACKGGGRSLRAAGFLLNHGYTEVVNMQYGMDRWLQKGFPTKGKAYTAANNSDCCSTAGCC